MSDPVRVRLTATMVDGQQVGLSATINGTTIPVTDYAVSPGDDGPVMSLAFPVTALTFGDGSERATQQPPTTAAQKARTTWGAAAKDPREAIPGWAPERADHNQVGVRAEDAAAQVHRA